MTPAAAVIACALSLLGRAHTNAPVQLIATPPPHASVNVEAFVTQGEPVIFVVMSSAAFQQALQEPWTTAHLEGCRKIAAILVHEEWHVRYGPDERGAYLAQLTTLRALGAQAETIALVRRAMAAVLGRSIR